MIKGKVAKIINDYSIAITVGSDDGVEFGMVFGIRNGGELIEVRDPDTQEVLGFFAPTESTKACYAVATVSEKFSIAESYQYLNPRKQLGPFARSLIPMRWQENYYPSEKSDDDKVKVGDIAFQIQKNIGRVQS